MYWPNEKTCNALTGAEKESDFIQQTYDTTQNALATWRCCQHYFDEKEQHQWCCQIKRSKRARSTRSATSKTAWHHVLPGVLKLAEGFSILIYKKKSTQ